MFVLSQKDVENEEELLVVFSSHPIQFSIIYIYKNILSF